MSRIFRARDRVARPNQSSRAEDNKRRYSPIWDNCCVGKISNGTKVVHVHAGSKNESALTLLAALNSAEDPCYGIGRGDISLEEIIEGRLSEVGCCIQTRSGKVACIEDGVLDLCQVTTCTILPDDYDASACPFSALVYCPI